MSTQPAPGSPLEGLQFEKAEYVDTRPQCLTCKTVIDSKYFHLAGQTICPTCAQAVRVGQERPKNQWVMRGALYGASAAAGCSIVYAIITWVTHMEIALIAILVGYLIGRAVRIGSRGLGGRRCQVIAVTLTYLAITMSYVPLLVKGLAEGADKKMEELKKAQPGANGQAAGVNAKADPPVHLTPVVFVLGIVFLVGLAIVAPFIGLTSGFSGILGILIIFFGLSRAWQLTARDARPLMGPYTLEGSEASA